LSAGRRCGDRLGDSHRLCDGLDDVCVEVSARVNVSVAVTVRATSWVTVRVISWVTVVGAAVVATAVLGGASRYPKAIPAIKAAIKPAASWPLFIVPPRYGFINLANIDKTCKLVHGRGGADHGAPQKRLQPLSHDTRARSGRGRRP